MLNIGDFSKVTGLSVKALRFYHEKGLLIPAAIDRETGYRFYDEACAERARIITALKACEFSLETIREILDDCEDESDLLLHLKQQRGKIIERIKESRRLIRSLQRVIENELEAREVLRLSAFKPEIKELPALLVGGIKVCGHYSECGPVFGSLGRKAGRYINGKPHILYYDGEFREEDANFEPCMPLKKKLQLEGVSVRELPAIRCISLVHQGPYERLGRSYEVALGYANRENHKIILPTREVCIKGPGMILKGNPRHYLTEIQLPIESR